MVVSNAGVISIVAGRRVMPGGGAYAATKFALEALVEGMAAEIAPLGLQAALLQPGAVTSGALDDVQRYSLPQDPGPYGALTNVTRDRSAFITVEQVVAEVATKPRPSRCRCRCRCASRSETRPGRSFA